MDCILMENCRLCQSKPGIFPFILDEEFIQKTMECTKITLDDDLNSLLPNFICDDCKMKILEFSEYINEVKRIDENLRRIASSYTQMDSPSKNDAEMESEHKCNKCPATFSDTETYDIHLKSHSTVSKFECTVCSKTFNRECNFELHMKNHLELYCSMCDSTFTNSEEKEVHICAVHVKKEEIEDDSDSKSFITSNSLICHEKIHLEVKEYTCKLCNIGFSVRSNLRAHEKKYHEGLRFYCSQCTKAFVTKCSLDRHEKIHAGVKEFSCTLCSSAFYTKKELTKHKRYHEMNQRSTITPEEIVEKAGKTAESLLPKKSEELYGREYEKFHSWMAENCIELINENVLFEYFEELSESFSPNSLWTKYSMLKKMLLLHENFDMGQYHKLGEYLKQESKGYESKKSKVLSGEHVLKFMYEAPNSSFLMVKVALLFGIFGGCRRQELVNMLVDHVEDRGSVIVVKIPPTKTDKKRVFTIIDDKEIHSFELIRKYVFLRPPNCSMRRFFLHYRDGCCVPKPVGKNTFGRISRTIAEYLGLSEIEKYTGHCLRKFSANLLADAGAITTTVEHPSELKSPADIEEVSTEQLATDEIVETAAKTTESLLPKKSEEVYGREYEKFHSWMRNNSVEITNETVLFKYFEELSESFSPNSLWTKYSMLKKMLLHHENFDMSKCQKLNDYLKQASKGYESKKSKVLSGQHALKFIYEAPNSSFLMVKVALLFGIFGGCRRQDLVNMLVDHVEDRGSVIVVKIPQTKIDKKRVFTIVDDKEMSSLELIREYVSLRPQDCSMRRFFLQYRNGCCTAQPVGKNTFGKISSIIAEYLGLSEANKYTGHCLRKISVDLLTDAWASRTATKHHNEWGVEEVVMKEENIF